MRVLISTLFLRFFDLKNNISFNNINKLFPDKKIFLYKKITSTNTLALKIAKRDISKKYNKTLIIAKEQTRGRGTQGRTWFSPRGMSLYTSIIIYPKNKIHELPYKLENLSELIGKEIFNTLKNEHLKECNLSLKLPNDILIDKKKVIGILCESSIRGEMVNYLIIGLGINLRQPRLKLPAELNGKIDFLEKHLKQNVNLMNMFQDIVNTVVDIFS